MKKIILSSILLPLIFSASTMLTVAQTSSTASSTSHKESKKEEKRERKAVVVDVPCLKTAIDKRENAVIAGFDQFATAFKTAIEARKNDLKAALDLTDKKARREATKAAVKKSRDARRDARKKFNEATRNAGKNFKKDAKACNVRGGEAEDQGETGDDE